MQRPEEEDTDPRGLALAGLKEAVAERDRCLEGKNLVVLELMARVGELEDELAHRGTLLQHYRRTLRRAHLPLHAEDRRRAPDEPEVGRGHTWVQLPKLKPNSAPCGTCLFRVSGRPEM